MPRDTPSLEDPPSGDSFWTSLARDAWDSSQSWFNSSLRDQFEKSMAHFRSQHAPGSKYHSAAYSKKSKFFRPKTRAAIRKNEMAMAVALFSTEDVLHCAPVNQANPRQVLAAEIKQQLVNHRLKDPETAWYLTAIAGAQEAMTLGCVVSRQHWRYEERQGLGYNASGGTDIGVPEIMVDRPAIDLVPLENFRISEAADWRNPVESSPFVIELAPMYVWELRKKASTIDPLTVTEANPAGETYYAPVDDPIIRASIEHDWESVRRLREGDERVDRYSNDSARINEYRTVFVHRNIVRVDGYDFCFDTLGPDILLSRPKPIEEVYWHCQKGRPYRMGFAIIEAHRLYPSGIPALTFSSQEYANDIINLRQDNVRLSLNKRYWVRRGSQTDVKSLIRNVAGGVTMMSDVARDVRETATPDVTGSAYEEQDRLNADFDEIAGSFSQSSVNTNRNLNETVGGMELIEGGAAGMQQYILRTIVETWVEPVIGQVVRMEEVYEADRELLESVAASQSLTAEQAMELLHERTTLKVDVGFGSTNPEQKINKIILGLGSLAKFFPQVVQSADQKEVAKVIFGALGFRDGSRFLPQLYATDEDPAVTQLTQENEMLRQMIEGKQLEMQSRENVAQIAAQSRIAQEKIKQETALLKEQAAGDLEQYRMSLQARFDEIEAQLKVADEERERMSLALEREALSHSILQADRDYQLRLKESSGEHKELMGTEAKNLNGKDEAGVISRDDYGAIPDSPH